MNICDLKMEMKFNSNSYAIHFQKVKKYHFKLIKNHALISEEMR